MQDFVTSPGALPDAAAAAADDDEVELVCRHGHQVLSTKINGTKFVDRMVYECHRDSPRLAKTRLATAV
ncbi:MAG: hypothetical protein MK041_10830, partial [Aquabacterium sp.]|nr:hypothetical protein [Aquabacterium sp.]